MDKQLKIVKTSYTLEKEISYATSLFPSKVVHLVTALTSLSISSLTEVTVPILISYNRFVFREFFGNANKYSSYKGDLECAMFSYFSATGLLDCFWDYLIRSDKCPLTVLLRRICTAYGAKESHLPHQRDGSCEALPHKKPEFHKNTALRQYTVLPGLLPGL